MSIKTLKQQIHLLIESIKNEGMLFHLYQMLHNHPSDILDDLSSDHRDRLYESLKQAERGEGISHEDMKAKVNSWFTN